MTTNNINIHDITNLLQAATGVTLQREDPKEKRYRWIQDTLVATRYLTLRKKEKGLVLQYLSRYGGYSISQVKRLVRQYRQTGVIRKSKRTQPSFPRQYTPEDIILLAKVTDAYGHQNGKAICQALRSMYETYGDERFSRLKDLSKTHYYRLKKRSLFRNTVRTYTKTMRTAVPIGERRKPVPDGKPGYIRVDSVHQGDREQEKGVYHLNLVDEVTQWQMVCCVEGIAEQFLLPALQEALSSFPFTVVNFHSDNGSEYINKQVAALLEKLQSTQTKGRPRKCNDNALVEGKHAATIRKHIGHGHIPKQYAGRINGFYRDHFNTFLNFHRYCAFPEKTVLSDGKVRKVYREYRTPLQKFLSLPSPEQYLKDGITLEALRQEEHKVSHFAAARAMQIAKQQLFT